MRFRFYSLIAATALLALSSTHPTIAQEDPLTVVPVGRTPSWYELAYLAVASVPSPIGDALPGLVAGNVTAVQLKIGLDRAEYAYDCGGDRCTGSAGQVWLALAPEQRQAYLDQVLDALSETFPGRVRRLQITGDSASRTFRMTVLQDADGNRTYIGL